MISFRVDQVEVSLPATILTCSRGDLHATLDSSGMSDVAPSVLKMLMMADTSHGR